MIFSISIYPLINVGLNDECELKNPLKHCCFVIIFIDLCDIMLAIFFLGFCNRFPLISNLYPPFVYRCNQVLSLSARSYGEACGNSSIIMVIFNHVKTNTNEHVYEDSHIDWVTVQKSPHSFEMESNGISYGLSKEVNDSLYL